MPARITERDLFGKPVRKRRPRYEWSLSRADKATLPNRAERVRWLEGVIPKNLGLLIPLETHFVFEEAKSSFVYGCFAATILLSAAFVEHWLAAHLSKRRFGKKAERGLAAMVDCCREHDLIDPILLDRIDRLRLIRNPIVHLRSFEHSLSMGQRSFEARSYPEEILQSDAKESLITMYTVARHAFAGT
ncbi:MAG: hypothetical protein AB1898_30575 [Acidobacteriota bacterium]